MESEAILTNKGRNLANGAGIEVLSSARLVGVDIGDVEVEAVGLGNSPDGDGAGVALEVELLAALYVYAITNLLQEIILPRW